MPTRSGRAAPLPPGDRRSAILAAAVPLLLDRGISVTTKDLAEAAGVAEGTLFRVFPDKTALVRAAVAQALDPASMMGELLALDEGAGLRPTLLAAVDLMMVRSREVGALLSVSHQLMAAAWHRAGSDPDQATPHGHDEPHGMRHGGHAPGAHPVDRVVEGVSQLLAPHAAELRLEPAVCGRVLVGLVMTTARFLPATEDAPPALTAEQVVSLFLDGALRRADTPTPSQEEQC